MATYRQVHVSFWQDPFVLDLTPEEKFFYLYLMTNSKTKQCGVYEITKKVMELETGYNRETIDKLMKRFIDYGKIIYSENTKEVCLVNWLKYNSFKSPKVLACISKELKEIKSETFREMTAREVNLDYEKSMDSLSIDWGEEEEKEEEEEREEETPSASKNKVKRHRYGEYDNVLLSDEELEKLKAEFPDYQQRIENLSSYVASTGKKYKNHLATIRNWAKKDKPKGDDFTIWQD